MKKQIVLSMAALAVMATSSYAGGDLTPIVTPVEPEPVYVDEERMPVYIGGGFVWGKYSGECGKNCAYEDVTYGGMLRGGYDFNEYIGIEARFIKTFLEEDPEGGQTLQHVGLYAKPMIPMGEMFEMYGLLGYGWTQTSTGGNGNLTEYDDSGFSAGIGMEVKLSSRDEDDESYENGWGLFLDYQRLVIDSEAPDMDVVSAGVTYDF